MKNFIKAHFRGCILLLHIPCKSFAALFVVRFLLGLAEACIVPSFLLILSMFFTYDEQSVLMTCMWAAGNSSPITSGLISYGVLWINTGNFAPWRWFYRKCLIELFPYKNELCSNHLQLLLDF
jgi:MFS family permease